MSKQSVSPGTPKPKSQSTSGPIANWLDRIIPLLDGVQQPSVTDTAASPQAAPAPPPYLIGGQQDAVEKAYDKIEAKKQAEEAKKQPEEAKKQAEAEAKWSFEDALRNRIDNLPPVFQFPTGKPTTLGPDEELRVGDNDYEKLPKDLKGKMTVEVWQAIKGQRAKLFTIYMRLKEYGAWDAVSKVTGIKEKLPPHGKLGALEFGIYGTGGIAFEEAKVGGLAAKLISTGHFGQDNKIMALWHQGQKSYREWRKEQITPAGVLDESIHEWGQKTPPPPSSLHISSGPGTLFDAHVDRIMPVAKPVDGQTVTGTDGAEHLGKEAIGPTIGGVTPTVTTNRDKVTGKLNTTVWLSFRLEWDFPSGNTNKRKRVYNRHPPQPEPPPVEVLKKIAARARKLSQKFPRTSDGDIDAEVLAQFIAGSVLAAAKQGKSAIGVDFPNYIDTTLSDAEQKQIHDAVLEIGTIVSSELGEQAASVKTVTVFLPTSGAMNVSIKK